MLDQSLILEAYQPTDSVIKDNLPDMIHYQLNTTLEDTDRCTTICKSYWNAMLPIILIQFSSYHSSEIV